MIRIRIIQGAEAPLAHDRIRQARGILRQNFPHRAHDADRRERWLRDPVKHGWRATLLVAETHLGRVNGLALVLHFSRVNSSFPDYIAVRRGIRGGGLGSALYEAVREHCSGVGSAGLYLDVDPDLAGFYCLDSFTPLDAGAYRAARASVDVALTAADEVLTGMPVAYAMCRPPGHHAERGLYGGFCYFDNAAIAANYLARHGRVAVLDIDFHHGNGTQDIFYRRGDVLTASIHGDPVTAYPYFSGFTRETGEGLGSGLTRGAALLRGWADAYRAKGKSIPVCQDDDAYVARERRTPLDTAPDAIAHGSTPWAIRYVFISLRGAYVETKGFEPSTC